MSQFSLALRLVPARCSSRQFLGDIPGQEANILPSGRSSPAWVVQAERKRQQDEEARVSLPPDGNYVPHRHLGSGHWPRAACGNRRVVPWQSLAQRCRVPTGTGSVYVRVQLNGLGLGLTPLPSSHKGTRRRKARQKGNHQTPTEVLEESLGPPYLPTGHELIWYHCLWRPLFLPPAHRGQ